MPHFAEEYNRREYMFDKELALEGLRNIKKVLDLIQERRATVKTPEDFLYSSEGMMRLDAICMNLIALGEASAILAFGDKAKHGVIIITTKKNK